MTTVCGRDAGIKKQKKCGFEGCNAELTNTTKQFCSIHDRPESTSRQFNEWLDMLSKENNETL